VVGATVVDVVGATVVEVVVEVVVELVVVADCFAVGVPMRLAAVVTEPPAGRHAAATIPIVASSRSIRPVRGRVEPEVSTFIAIAITHFPEVRTVVARLHDRAIDERGRELELCSRQWVGSPTALARRAPPGWCRVRTIRA